MNLNSAVQLRKPFPAEVPALILPFPVRPQPEPDMANRIKPEMPKIHRQSTRPAVDVLDFIL